MIADSRPALVQKSIVSYACSSDLPTLNYRFSWSVSNREIEQQTSVLIIFSFPQSDLIVKKQKSHLKNSCRKTEKPRGPLPFFEIFSRFFIEFFTLNIWNSLRGINYCYYHRLLPA